MKQGKPLVPTPDKNKQKTYLTKKNSSRQVGIKVHKKKIKLNLYYMLEDGSGGEERGRADEGRTHTNENIRKYILRSLIHSIEI
jgi:hypothetical protein